MVLNAEVATDLMAHSMMAYAMLDDRSGCIWRIALWWLGLRVLQWECKVLTNSRTGPWFITLDPSIVCCRCHTALQFVLNT